MLDPAPADAGSGRLLLVDAVAVVGVVAAGFAAVLGAARFAGLPGALAALVVGEPQRG